MYQFFRINFIVSIEMNSLTKTERENLIKVYKKLDENGDGKLARVELINAVRNYLDETNQAETETKRRQGTTLYLRIFL